MNNVKFVIPARKGSKGLPGKNRILIEKTLNTIPDEFKKNVYIGTDDEAIIEKYASDYNVIVRDDINCNDTASTKDAIIDIVKKSKFKNTDEVVMLYTTYPDREWSDIQKAYNFFKNCKESSMLCKLKIEVSPYLILKEEGLYGKKLFNHDLYRRQDYPNCFEISHFISIFKVDEIKNLNSNMYNEKTVFYSISDIVDVDEKKDLEKFYEKNKNNC